VILPIFRFYVRIEVSGLEQLDAIEAPVLFAANHTSDLDTVAILAALPSRWRRRLAPAARQEYFEASSLPQGPPLKTRFRKSLEYYAAGTLFNTYLIPQKMAGLQKALRYSGTLVEAGYCPLLYPEGGRSRNGQLQPFKGGIGLMAIRLEIGVLPIHLSGLFQVLSVHDRWPKRGQCTVRLGSLLKPEGERDFLAFTRRVEKAVHELKQQEDMDSKAPSADG
jgi:1-acyl-sn-glycerol-3-phosphate acyltransferase